MIERIRMTDSEISSRWPHISRYLRVDSAGWVDDYYLRWYFANERVSLPCVEVAAAYEEWADFYQFRLEQRSDELAEDYRKRNLVERWTEDMTYCIRRSAAYARGEDPGEPVPMSGRRPDLEATHRAIVDEIIASIDADRQPAEVPVRQLRKAGSRTQSRAADAELHDLLTPRLNWTGAHSVTRHPRFDQGTSIMIASCEAITTATVANALQTAILLPETGQTGHNPEHDREVWIPEQRPGLFATRAGNPCSHHPRRGA